jgi:hypothetical protein
VTLKFIHFFIDFFQRLFSAISAGGGGEFSAILYYFFEGLNIMIEGCTCQGWVWESVFLF